MRRSVPIALGVGVLLSLSGTLLALAHGTDGKESLQVEPGAVTAGGSVIMAGSGLEPDNDRILVLVGQGLTVDLGTVTTDGDGKFSKELTIPSHLPAGTYELRAIGDEPLTVPLAVTAASGATEASSQPGDTKELVVDRKRSPLELALILALVAVAATLGVLLAWRAERFGGAAAAES